MNAGGGTDGRRCFGGGGDTRKLVTKAGGGMDGSLWTSSDGDTKWCYQLGAGSDGT